MIKRKGKHMVAALSVVAVLLFSSGIQAFAVISPERFFEADDIFATEVGEEPDLKFEHTPTLAEDFKDDSVLVVLKHQNSRVNQKIDPAAFETEKLTLTTASELSQERTAIDDSISLDSSRSDIKFIDVQDLTRVPQDAADSPLINKTVFNQILRIRLQTKGKDKVLEAIAELKKIEGVLDAEPEYNYYIQEDMTPNDPYFATQSWGLKKIQMERAWDITTGGNNVKVGVMEAGIASHSDLNTNILAGNFTPDATADLSHGTHVAGIIGAVSNNGIGIAGTAQVGLVPLDRTKFVDSLAYANNNNIEIINASFYYVVSSTDNTPAPPSTVHANAIQQYNGLLICSAGNASNNTDSTPQYPADYPCDNIISVASTDSNDTLASSSNYGAVSVDLAAPGVGILSTYPPAMCSNGTHKSGHVANGYHTMNGTSMAAPHVTGVAALILAHNPNMDALQIKSAILKSVDSVPGLAGKCYTGGRLNAYKALLATDSFPTDIQYMTVSGDFNGDGKSDLAYGVGSADDNFEIHVRLSNGSSYEKTQMWFTHPSMLASNMKYRFVAGDFNGDGKDDIATMYNYTSSTMRIIVFLSNGTSFSTYQTWFSAMSEGQFMASRVNGRFVAGDFNGDGKDDLAGMYEYSESTMKILVFVSSGTAFDDYTWYSAMNTGQYMASHVTNRFVSGDFDGDGKDDLAAMYEYPDEEMALHVFKSTGSAFTGTHTWLALRTPGAYIAERASGRFVAGDFDHDGKDDLAALYEYNNSAMQIHVMKSSGSAFTKLPSWKIYSAGSYDASRIIGLVTAGDTNGDGKDDITALYRYNNGLRSPHRFISTGTSF